MNFGIPGDNTSTPQSRKQPTPPLSNKPTPLPFAQHLLCTLYGLLCTCMCNTLF